MSIKFEDSHMQDSWKQSTSFTSTNKVQQDSYRAGIMQGQGQHHISCFMVLSCMPLDKMHTITKIHFMHLTHNHSACCFRRGHLAVQCVEKSSNAPPPSPLICSYIQTPGPTPASTVASGSTRSPTWRNTPSFTPVGLKIPFGCSDNIHMKLLTWSALQFSMHHLC